ncbi:MAG: recombinase family protein [Armatimonadetes bacterium]|nr:recombinase family protein [Armatimonadota bacterium]
MRAAVYMRVSTEEQRERQTIETQKAFALRYCEQAGITIADWYADEGVSGTVALESRTQGARLLADAIAGRFEIVLVYRVDRLGRDTWIIEDAVRRLRAASVRFASITEMFDAATPHGKLLQSILGATATYERDVIVARSIEATRRLAQEGAWMGGIVPYGYKVVGDGRNRRLAVSEDALPGLEMSEADVIRLIFKLSAEDGKSCSLIADHLNALGVPPSYAKDERKVLRGKRKQATAGIWRQGRVGNLIRSSTYKGVHVYGKRTRGGAEPIERLCAPIVSEAVWDAAQATLRKNFLFCVRNSRRQYLLRALIRCGTCGRSFTGVPAKDYADGRFRSYYRCSGRNHYRAVYGADKCDAPNVNGEDLEREIVSDILGFLTHPQTVIKQLTRRMEKEIGADGSRAKAAERWRRRLAGLNTERDRILVLFRKDLITEEELQQQLDDIRAASDLASKELAKLSAGADRETQLADYLNRAEQILHKLKGLAAGDLSYSVKRALVEALVGGIKIKATEMPDGRKAARVLVTYLFAPVRTGIDNHTDIHADINPGLERSFTLIARTRGAKQ